MKKKNEELKKARDAKEE
jgi:hypothetical protein